MSATSQLTVLAVWVWGNAEKVLRETPPSCSNLPTKSFPFSEKVFMPALRHAELASLIFRPGYGPYGSTNKQHSLFAEGLHSLYDDVTYVYDDVTYVVCALSARVTEEYQQTTHSLSYRPVCVLCVCVGIHIEI